ncbi:MAG: hypothetical protein AAB425_11785 [Bdellovibrionota bacterium]
MRTFLMSIAALVGVAIELVASLIGRGGERPFEVLAPQEARELLAAEKPCPDSFGGGESGKSAINAEKIKES